MGKEKKTVKLEKHEPDMRAIIVGEVKKSTPRMRIVKSKEKIKVTASDSRSTTDKATTTCETSGNIMRLCVNLMPVLASAKEPMDEEEEEEKEEDISCKNKEEPKTGSKNDRLVTKLVQQTLDASDSYTGLTLGRATETKQSPNPRFVLPTITQPKPAPECCDHQRTKRFLAPLSPISLLERTTTISPNFATKGFGDDAPVTGQVSDSRPWIDNPMFSKSTSAEFRLPDISLSSLDALLQTVTQKLRRKRRGGDEGPWRQVQSDHLLTAVSEQRLSEERIGKQTRPAYIGAATETSVGGPSVNRQRSLLPILSAPKPTLFLTMTKKNHLTSPTLQ
ncbi:uncharacterized protein LOC120791088 isoform X2 [Xiphias gladius]|uniref:uncharacterized protein LOC120791088 isoform X2 n=1 Tax=Xiphias gladius TaxID=8245 RepID=UPI001A97D82D|nr:uncharacterized protein LOC120791088 isoform X2 [Xiphias gladius]